MTVHGLPVVAGVDGSASSREAAAFAAQEARRRGAPLHLLHVVSWPYDDSAELRAADSEWAAELGARADELLRTVAASLRGILHAERISASVEHGNPVRALRDAGEEAQLLVLGSRGLGGVSGLIVGSTATDVAASAACPVVVLPDATRGAVSERRSVVVGVEGRGRDDDVLTFAFAEAALRGTELVAVHAWRDAVQASGGPQLSPVLDWGGVLAEEQRLLAEALAGHREKEPDVPVREAVLRDRTAAALVGMAVTAELLVVGRPHGGRLARLGSATHGVLHRAGCPVAVVPVPASPVDAR